MKINTQSFTGGLIISSFLLQFSAFAVDPVRYSQLSMGSEMVTHIEKMVEKRAERFMALEPAKQIKFLDRADRRYSHLISRVENWSEAKFQRKLSFAQNFLAIPDESAPTELSNQEQKDLPFNSDEKEFYQSEDDGVATLQPSTTNLQANQPAIQQTKADLVSNLRANQQSIRALKSDILKQAKNNVGSFRKIAASSAVKGVLTAVFAILIVAGVFCIVFGLAITIATLGILAPAGIALVTLGAIVITGSIIAVPLVWTKM